MGEKKDKTRICQVNCPSCQSILWVDSTTGRVVKSEKGKRSKGSLDELLVKEQKRKSEFDRKFQATADIEKEKRKEAQERFKEVLKKIDQGD